MRDFAVDFQPHRPRPLSIVLLVAGLLLCTEAWLEGKALRVKLEEAEAQLNRVRQHAEQLDTSRRDSRPENVFSMEESKALRQAINAIRVDWGTLFRRIDTAVSDDVSLLAIRPNATGKSVQISGEGRDMAAVLAFVEALQHAPLSHALLLSHQIKQTDPQHPVVFEISAQWSTDT